MSSRQRRVGLLILIALLMTPIMLFAQDAVSIVGSGIPAPLISAFAGGAEVNVTGTNSGFTALCAGEADIAIATRSISSAEEALCTQNGVSFLETVLGYDILAVVANPDVTATCLPTLQLNTIFAPSSTVTNWNQVDPSYADLPLSLVVPQDNTSAFALLDDLVEGVGVRDDATTVADSAEIISTVSSTSGALAVTSLTAAEAAGDAVKILNLNTTSAGCAAPSAANAQGRTYTAAYILYAYANAASIDAVEPILAAASAEGSAETVAGAGFIAPVEAVSAQNREIVANRSTGRQFSGDVTEFAIPANLVGAINISGAASGSAYLTAATAAFVQAYPGVTLNQTIDGQPDGFTRLCDGTADLIDAFAEQPATPVEACTADSPATEAFNLGSSAVVLLANVEGLTCLTTAEVTVLWGASAEPATNWNQVNAAFADLPIALVAPTLGDPNGDLLMLRASGQNLPTRADFAETKDDAGYRATAIGNVDGGATYMTWEDYQSLSAETQAAASLLGVNSGSGCVTPSLETIADGSYALSRPLYLLVNRLSMARQEIQALLWFISSDANFSLLANNGLVGLDFSTLPDLRDRLQQLFAQAAEESVQAAIDAANATPEATSEATDTDATEAAPVVEATEAAAEPTEAAPEPTTEATAEATQNS